MRTHFFLYLSNSAKQARWNSFRTLNTDMRLLILSFKMPLRSAWSASLVNMIATHMKGQEASWAARALRSATEVGASASSSRQSDMESAKARLAPARSSSIKLSICMKPKKTIK